MHAETKTKGIHHVIWHVSWVLLCMRHNINGRYIFISTNEQYSMGLTCNLCSQSKQHFFVIINAQAPIRFEYSKIFKTLNTKKNFKSVCQYFHIQNPYTIFVHLERTF